jgi:hypothetical protein
MLAVIVLAVVMHLGSQLFGTWGSAAAAPVSASELAAMTDLCASFTFTGTALASTWGYGDPCENSWHGVECNPAPNRIVYASTRLFVLES